MHARPLQYGRKYYTFRRNLFGVAMTKVFRFMALFEGLSFLTLLFVAMPMKYWMGMPLAVKFVGMAHGFLFLAYCLFAFLLASENKWPLKQHLLAYVAAVLPFGTFVFDRRYMAR